MYLTEMRLEILVRWSCPILWKMLSEFKELYHDVSFDFISLDDIDGIELILLEKMSQHLSCFVLY